MCFIHIPTARTGAISPTPKCSPGGKDIFHVDLSNFKKLIEDFNHITLEQVMAFASWFMGNYGQLLVVHPSTNMKMKYINVNAPGNPGLVACFKQECCTVSCLVWHTQSRTNSPQRVIKLFSFARKNLLANAIRWVTSPTRDSLSSG